MVSLLYWQITVVAFFSLLFQARTKVSVFWSIFGLLHAPRKLIERLGSLQMIFLREIPMICFTIQLATIKFVYLPAILSKFTQFSSAFFTLSLIFFFLQLQQDSGL